MAKKDYCTQNNGDCSTCSLVNYGMDCRNVPLTTAPPKATTKLDRAMATYVGFKGDVTVRAVLAQIPQELQDSLTAKQLGMVMSAVNQAYHNGRASTGAEVVDGDAVWIDSLKQLIPLEDIYKITEHICLRCGHHWHPDSATHPTICPKCKSPYWDKPRKTNV